MSCDTLSDVFAKCLLDHVMKTEKSYSAYNIASSTLKNSIIINSKNENTSANKDDDKGILSLNKGMFQGVNIRLLSRVLADDVAHSLWNIQASDGQVSVSGSGDQIPSISFFLFALFPNFPDIFFYFTNS